MTKLSVFKIAKTKFKELAYNTNTSI